MASDQWQELTRWETNLSKPFGQLIQYGIFIEEFALIPMFEIVCYSEPQISW